MKQLRLLIIFLLIGIGSTAQTSYQYVIIPTQIPEIGEGFNPYHISSNIQKTLMEKNINSIFDTNKKTEKFCDGLTLKLTNTSTMFRSKLTVELVNCIGQVVWEGNGIGYSKGFAESFAEAFQDATKDLTALPSNNTKEANKPAPKMESVINNSEKKPVANSSADELQTNNDAIYHPENLYYNYQYFIDLIFKAGDSYELLLVNSETLGYDENLQPIAHLSSTGLDGVYAVSWLNPDGSKKEGLANLSDTELTLSFIKQDEKEIIRLVKY